jgi:putative holliday junction resolvase
MKKGCVIGLDYGTKRTGIAITDELQMIASPLITIHTKDLTAELKKLVEEKKVVSIVLGEPKNLDGTPTDSTALVQQLQKHLQRTFPGVDIILVDERFTSKMAASTMVTGGVPKMKRRNKETLDQVSAAIILKSWLDQKRT